jgi:hypothetical protein
MLNRMTIAIACAMVMLGAAFGGAAAQSTPTTPTPDAMQAANDLFGILGKDMVQNLVATAMVQAWPPIDTDLTLKKVDKATIASLQKEYERLQTENINAALKDLPAVYAHHFSASEMRELIARRRSARNWCKKCRRLKPNFRPF